MRGKFHYSGKSERTGLPITCKDPQAERIVEDLLKQYDTKTLLHVADELEHLASLHQWD